MAFLMAEAIFLTATATSARSLKKIINRPSVPAKIKSNEHTRSNRRREKMLTTEFIELKIKIITNFLYVTNLATKNPIVSENGPGALG